MSSRTWADLFERAAAHETGVEAIRAALAARRGEREDDPATGDGAEADRD